MPGPVCLGGLFLGVDGTFPGIGNAQSCGDDQHLGQAILPPRLEEHSSERGINREPGEISPQRSHVMEIVQAAQFVEQLVTGSDGGRCRGIEKGKGLDLTELERLHAKDDFGEIGTLDFWCGKGGTFRKLSFRPETDADAVAESPCPSSPLVGAALGDVFDRKALGPVAGIVAAHPRQSCVDHGPDTGQRDGCLGDIRGDDDAAPGTGFEHPLLFPGGHSSEQSEHFGAPAQTAFQQVTGFPDVPFSWHEDEDVAIVGFEEEILHGIGRGFQESQVFRLLFWRRIPDLYRVQPSGDLNDRSIPKMRGKRGRVDGGGGDEQLQIGAPWQEVMEIAEQKIDVEGPFVRFIEDQCRIASQQRV